MGRCEEQFRRVAIVGTGLIGGSFGLAARRALEGARIVGWDHKHVLREAEACGAIHEGVPGLERALAGADLVYVALPVGVALELVPAIARHAEPHCVGTRAR